MNSAITAQVTVETRSGENLSLMGFRNVREKAKPGELWWWTRIEPIIPETADVWVGQTETGNPLSCPGTPYTFQFGDIRIELPSRTIAIEVESVGSPLSNLLKFW